jgi:hypothetical protein
MPEPRGSDPLPYRSGRDAARGEPKIVPRSLRTWLLMSVVWVVGLGVWVVYLVAIGFLVFRVLL